MKRTCLVFLACLAIINASAQSTIDEVFTTLSPNNSMQFYVINSNIYGLDYTDGVVRKYDKVWNLQETHDAHQDTYDGKTMQTASQGYEYNSGFNQYQLKEWENREPTYTKKKRYTFSATNFTEFWQGEENEIYYIKQTNKLFIST